MKPTRTTEFPVYRLTKEVTPYKLNDSGTGPDHVELPKLAVGTELTVLHVHQRSDAVDVNSHFLVHLPGPRAWRLIVAKIPGEIMEVAEPIVG